ERAQAEDAVERAAAEREEDQVGDDQQRQQRPQHGEPAFSTRVRRHSPLAMPAAMPSTSPCTPVPAMRRPRSTSRAAKRSANAAKPAVSNVRSAANRAGATRASVVAGVAFASISATLPTPEAASATSW